MNSASHLEALQAEPGRGITGQVYAVCFIIAFGLAAAFSLSSMIADDHASHEREAARAAEGADPYSLILDALLTPALEPDAAPLRWVDPQASVRCGPHTEVRVNHRPLVAGALVPETPFELEWRADGCRPYAAPGARIDGDVKLTVFREDWGFSAIVEPSGLRIASAGYEHPLAKRGGAWLRRCDSLAPTTLDDGERPPCG